MLFFSYASIGFRIFSHVHLFFFSDERVFFIQLQRAVLEPAMEGRDMIGRARTGTGKTLAFGIPIMDKIIKFNEKHG